ncbi:ABC transporter ATP-binding protein [Rhizobium sp. ZPR3]|uniref:ABC transporter ATP-binding protein n=2 Tax=unclassified Rhizobium TaxID=2613769 RepID=A0AAU7S9I4_9HYPH
MLRRFISYYHPYKKLLAITLISAVIAGLLELRFPIIVKIFVDDLLPAHDWGLIIWSALLLMFVYAINGALLAIVNYYGHLLGINIETDMRQQAFSHIQQLSFRYFDNNSVGDLITNVTKDLEEIGEVAHHGPEDIVLSVMTFFGAAAIMFYIHWKLGLLVTCLVPTIAWASGRYGVKLAQNWRNLLRQISLLNQTIAESVGGIRIVKAFSNESHEYKAFRRRNHDYRRIKKKAYAYMTTSTTISYLGTRSVQLLVLVAGAWYVAVGEITQGSFVGILLIVNVLFKPIERLGSFLETYPKAIAGFRRFLALIDSVPEVTDNEKSISVEKLRGEIAYNNVTFSYSPHLKVLDRFNLRIGHGEKIAFVGASGVGKTTICSLLPRFYDVNSGSITIEGIDIRDITQSSLRKQIGLVQQDPFLFTASIRENVAYGRIGASSDEIETAVQRAALGDFIELLPDGLDTLVGERGVKLSGGQKQRIAIARLFLKNPPILILDEATSALDYETECLIQSALTELMADRTAMIIAHRLSTIKQVDRIIVIGKNGILEQGTHDELLRSGAHYARLYESQFVTELNQVSRELGTGAATSGLQ